jgi:hypothetical protein
MIDKYVLYFVNVVHVHFAIYSYPMRSKSIEVGVSLQIVVQRATTCAYAI